MKYARIELERRWLVTEPPPGWAPEQPHRVIDDRYLVGTRMRLRRMGEVLKLGLKEPVPGQPATHRWMTNFYLTQTEYEKLALLEARSLRKRRYSLDGCSLDVFDDGLMLAEKEFADEESMRAYEPPAWVAREVTSEEAFTGGILADGQFDS